LKQSDIDNLRSWEGNQETREDTISVASVRALASTLDYDPAKYNEGVALPPLYHWLTFLETTRFSEMAEDGHAEKGGFIPPVPFPRRMFAGGRIKFSGDLLIGQKVKRISTIQSVIHKNGRTGEIIFVTVEHQISNEHGVQLVEEHDIAYLPGPQKKQDIELTTKEIPKSDFSRLIKPDERLLFRFSALTFNSHRIHYDLPYVQSEGYPAVVVHGPLTAMLLADLVWRENEFSPLKEFSFRAKNALYIGDTIHLAGNQTDGVVQLSAHNDHGVECFSARGVLR
tara:strand:- start:357 stop:1205 length:849 start_codon:yes stop_codon:yes gene_type:complete